MRLCITIDGFRKRHGHWPSRVRMPKDCIGEIRDRLFTASDFAKITAKVTLVPNEQRIVAEDDGGATFMYGEAWGESSTRELEPPSAGEWLGVHPRPNDSH